MPFCKIHKNVALKGDKCPECEKSKKYVDDLDITPASGGIGPPSGMPASAGENIAVCPFPVTEGGNTSGLTPAPEPPPAPTDTGSGDAGGNTDPTTTDTGGGGDSGGGGDF